MTGHMLIGAAWAGLLALDFTGIGPFMVAQPLVCGPLFGFLFGQTIVGILIGGITQLLWLDVTPIGVGIPFDVTAVTVLATYWGTRPPHAALSQIILALFIAVPFGFLFKAVDLLARRLNSRFAHAIDRASDAALPTAVSLGIIGSLFWTWLRFTILFAGCMAVGRWIWMKLAYWPHMTRVDQGLTMAVLLLPVAGLGVALELFLSEEPQQRFHGWLPGRRNRRVEDGPP